MLLRVKFDVNREIEEVIFNILDVIVVYYDYFFFINKVKLSIIRCGIGCGLLLDIYGSVDYL